MTQPLSATFAEANTKYEGTRLYTLLERVVIELKDPATVVLIGRAALAYGEQHRRIVVVPTDTPQWEPLTLSGYGRRIKPHDCWVYAETEAAHERLIESFGAALQRAGILTADIGEERPLTEEEEDAGIASAGPCAIISFTARWMVCDPNDEADTVPMTGMNIHEHLVGPDATEPHIEDFAVEELRELDEED